MVIKKYINNLKYIDINKKTIRMEILISIPSLLLSLKFNQTHQLFYYKTLISSETLYYEPPRSLTLSSALLLSRSYQRPLSGSCPPRPRSWSWPCGRRSGWSCPASCPGRMPPCAGTWMAWRSRRAPACSWRPRGPCGAWLSQPSPRAMAGSMCATPRMTAWPFWSPSQVRLLLSVDGFSYFTL